MPQLFERDNVQPIDVTFYNVVRTTTTNVDGQRLTAAIYGTTIPLTILVAAATITYYFREVKVPIDDVIIALILLSILVIAHSFELKVNFIKYFVISLVIAFIIIAAAAVIYRYFGGAIVAINYLLAALLCAIAVMIAQAFVWKIEKFNYFIKTSVDIGEKIEDIFITLEGDLCLTQRFNEQPIAGDQRRLYIHDIS